MKLNDEEWLKIINNKETAVIDFSAEEWCTPCKMIGPIIDKLSEKYPNINIGKIEIDDNDKLATKYNVRNIPTILFFKDGNVVDKTVGAVSIQTLEDKIKLLISEN